jgi:hypothetical protein
VTAAAPPVFGLPRRGRAGNPLVPRSSLAYNAF